jgi:hypothetical protein
MEGDHDIVAVRGNADSAQRLKFERADVAEPDPSKSALVARPV